jgi:hypothetical protein
VQTWHHILKNTRLHINKIKHLRKHSPFYCLSRAKLISLCLAKLHPSHPTDLTVEIPRVIEKLFAVEPRSRQYFFGQDLKQAMDDFRISRIRIISTDNYDKIIERYMDGGDESLLEVIDDELALRIIAAKDDNFSLDSTGFVSGFGEKLARMQASHDVLRPTIQIFAEGQLPLDLRKKVEKRLNEWMNNEIARLLVPLLQITESLNSESQSFTPQAKKVATALVQSVGILERKRLATEVKMIDQKERPKLRKFGVRFGAFHIYIPSLLKPVPRALAAQLYLISTGSADANLLEKLKRLAASGRTSIARDPGVDADLYRAIGYRPFNTYAMRVDILERLADLIRAPLLWSEQRTR